jgi:succinyl-diaminopimelate desuccinylase
MINAELRAKVQQFAQENRDAIIQDIKDLVAIKSIAGQPAEGMPFGPGPRAALDKALEMAERFGLKTVNVDNYIGYAELPGESEDYLATVCHLDVVPEGNGWKADPFTVREIDGWLLGRGVCDNKGASVLSMYMLKFFKEQGIKLRYSTRAIWGTDEETGSTDVAYYLKKEKHPLFIFSPDANFPVCCGEKGICSFQLFSKKVENSNVVKFNAGTAGNVIPDLAEVTFKKEAGAFPAADGIEIVETEDGVRVIAYGIGGHAAFPAGTKNAIGMLVAYGLENNLFSEEEKPYFELLAKLHGVTDGSGLGIDADDGYFEPLTCIGGIMKFEDGVFTQHINIRYPTNTDPDKMHAILAPQFEAVGGHVPTTKGSKPMFIDPETPIIRAMQDTYNEITGLDTKPYTIGGGTYARSFPLGVAFGIEPKGDELPDFVGTAHMAEEGYSIEGFMSALEILTLSMYELHKLDY